MDYNYKKSGTIFNAHSYWTKQPSEVISRFIQDNTKIGDIVLDPFCGTGMTGVAAIMTNRQFVLSDLSPTCVHISNGYCTKLGKFDATKLLNDLLSDIEHDYYTTICPECKEPCSVDYYILSDRLETENDTPIDKVVFYCEKCKKRFSRPPEDADLSKHNCDDYTKYYYPKANFFGQEPRRNYKKGIRKVYQLYSKRNLCALTRLLSNIKKLEDSSIRSICLFAFTSIVFNCSLMSRYNPKYKNTQIRMGTFYIPGKIKDNNVAQSYRRKLNGILKSNKLIFCNNKIFNGKVTLSSATNLSYLQDESIDYIYTDPPYSDKISYSELNIVYESWLGEEYTDTASEMIVSKRQNKSIVNYSEMFSQFLNEAYRVLKPFSRITIIFHNSSLVHWKYFQNVVSKSGFVPIKKPTPDRIISRAKTSTQYQSDNISRCFLAFTLEKKPERIPITLKSLSRQDYENLIMSLRNKAGSLGYINKSDQYDFLMNSLIYEYELREDIHLI